MQAPNSIPPVLRFRLDKQGGKNYTGQQTFRDQNWCLSLDLLCHYDNRYQLSLKVSGEPQLVTMSVSVNLVPNPSKTAPPAFPVKDLLVGGSKEQTICWIKGDLLDPYAVRLELEINDLRPPQLGPIDHGPNQMVKTYEMYQQRVFTDLICVVAEREFHVHSLILWRSSGYFQTLLSSDFRESKDRRVVLEGVDPLIFEEVIEYFYTGRIPITEQNVIPVLYLADYLQATALYEAAIPRLKQLVTKDNMATLIKTIYSMEPVNETLVWLVCT